MKKVYFLQTCDTCRRILKEVNLDGFEKQEIKTNPITVAQLEAIRELTDSYESLFSRRARKYRLWELNKKELGEEDYRNYILEEYTFLKRPVFLVGNRLFFGGIKKSLTQLKEILAAE